MKSSGLISTKLFVKFTIVAVSIAICLSPAWAGRETVTIMTRNLYIGAEIQSLAGAETPEDFLEGVVDALAQMASNNFPERAEALAAEIVEKKPHLVALQEVYDITFNGENGPPPFRDYLDDLLDALDDQGASYRVAAIVDNINLPITVPSPSPPYDVIGVLDRDVILARYDVEADSVDLSSFCVPLRQSVDGCNYQVVAIAEDTPVGDIPFERGFVAVDARVGDFEFRFFNTHLEVRIPDPTNILSPLVQRLQAAELIFFLNLPTPRDFPVIVAGDINSSPEDPDDFLGLMPPYMQLENAGYVDVWTLRPGRPRGYTCCFEEDLREPADLYERIDVIFSSELPDRVKANVVGNSESDRTVTGLWPSDHAGVVARLFFEPFLMPQKPFKAKKRR